MSADHREALGRTNRLARRGQLRPSGAPALNGAADDELSTFAKVATPRSGVRRPAAALLNARCARAHDSSTLFTVASCEARTFQFAPDAFNLKRAATAPPARIPAESNNSSQHRKMCQIPGKARMARPLPPEIDRRANTFERERASIMFTTIRVAAKADRLSHLRMILESRRLALVHEVRDRIRDVRSDGVADRDVLDAAESSEVDTQDHIGLALIRLKAETLNKIDAALRRIDGGNYGDCFECGGEISEARLRALPFAVRCRDCEELHEVTDRRERSSAQRRGFPALFLDRS